MILHTLIGDQDWQFEIYRLKIQKFIDKIQPPKQEATTNKLCHDINFDPPKRNWTRHSRQQECFQLI